MCNTNTGTTSQSLDLVEEANACTCPTPAAANDVRTDDANLHTSSYTVVGMTCGHCVSSVTAELSAVPGVRNVKVDLATGIATVASDQPLADEGISAAIDEAGYELAGTPGLK